MCPKYEYVNLEVEKTLTQSGISVVYFSLQSQRPYAATDDTDWRNFLIQTVFYYYVLLHSSSRRNVEYKNKYELFQQQSRILGSRLSGLSCLAPDIQQAQQTTLTEAWLTSYLIGWERCEVVISAFICQELARTVPLSPRSATRLLCARVRASVCKNARERKEFIQYRWIRSRKELSSF